LTHEGRPSRHFGLLSSEGVTLSRLEVSERVSQLSAGIAKILQHKEGVFTPVFVDYSLDSQLFILAMSASGQNFAVLDSTTPVPVLEKQLQQLNARVGISIKGDITGLHTKSLESVFGIEDFYRASEDKPPITEPEAGSIVIFSSGSTGTPKGIVIPWLELDEWIRIRLTGLGLTPRDESRTVNLSPLSWIAGILNLLGVQYGTDLHTLDPLKFTPRQLLENIQEVDPQYILLTGHLGSVLGKVASTSSGLFFASLRYLHFGSSALRWETVNEFRHVVSPDATLSYVYAASEAMRPLVFQKQISEAPASGPVPIGIPRDPDNLFLRPTGEGSFEIIVSGTIASGYLDKSLTAEKFVTDENGKTWWLSGDLVRLDESSGNYYFVGRLDDFVKVNDHNVSLVEVDSALNAKPGVLNSLTLAAEHKGRTRIVSFIETKPGSNLDQDQVIQFLRARIPSYSIPQLVLVLDAFPLTRSGKPDRAKLRNLAVLQFSRNSN